MNRKLATAGTTGALAMAILAGSAATADAGSLTKGPVGPIKDSRACIARVTAERRLGYWDCQPVAGSYRGWYAVTGDAGVAGPYTAAKWCVGAVAKAGSIGRWDCESIGGAYAGWYIFTP